MGKPVFKKLALLSILLLLLGGSLVYFKHDIWIQTLTERTLNKNLNEFLNGSLRLYHMDITKTLNVSIEKAEGEILLRDGTFPFEIRDIVTETSLLALLEKKPLTFQFRELKPKGSKEEGLSGFARYEIKEQAYFNFEADIVDLRLEELVRFNPENLEGSTGALRGKVTFSASEDLLSQTFKLDLFSGEEKDGEAGTLQSKFFDIFLPYLPKVERLQIKARLGETSVIHYESASLSAELISKENMKILLKILIPEYNLNLNLNMQIRLEEGNSFLQLAEIMGLIQFEASAS